MAIQQSFGYKSKKKDKDSSIYVKVIKGYKSEKGSTKFVSRFVKIKDIAEVDKIDIAK